MDYGKLYNENYYKTSCGNIPYTDKQFKIFFKNMANLIVNTLHPQRVLDVGCAMGYLVAALRDKGVEAYGIDVSEYAISQVRDDIKPYCKVCSALEPLPNEFPKKYDLVTNIEVAEHLYEEDGKKLIENICSYSNNILFSSTSNDFSEKTHVNVQQPEYWAKIFAGYGFIKQLNYKADFISHDAYLFVNTNLSKERIIENYEHYIRILKADKNKIFGKLYYDNGNGFNEDNVIPMLFSSNKPNTLEIPLPVNTKAVRFDPVETPCILKNFQALSVDPKLKISHAGTVIGDYIIFPKQDPKITIDLNKQTVDLLKFKFEILPIKEDTFYPLLKKFSELPSKHEENLLQKEKEYNKRLEKNLNEFKSELIKRDKRFHKLYFKLNKDKKIIVNLQSEKILLENKETELSEQIDTVTNMYNIVTTSTCWKMTKPIRFVLDNIKRLLKLRRGGNQFYKGLVYLKHYGIRTTYYKTKNYLKSRKQSRSYTITNSFTAQDLKKQKNTVFPKNIKFSILVPLYNTPEQFLTEMIDSVKAQTYNNWELCLADGSDVEHSNVEKICLKYAKKDKRIRYKKLKKNLGISENTNECIRMSTGDYIGLLDHDDILHPSALFENMKVICEKNADFIYTDEATFEGKIDNIITAHFKPDYAIDNLRANNYICHFTVFRKNLLNKVGLFRSEFDGSQDHDFVLRVTSKANHIVHIPMILYFWRAHNNSVASNIDSKKYAIDAGKRAVSDNILHSGQKAVIESSRAFPTIYRIKYKINEKPLVSILIPNKDNLNFLKSCIDSILSKTTYPKYEILILDNESKEQALLNYYHTLSSFSNIKVISWNFPFNYSAINNFGAQYANGKYLIFLNNDTKVITPEWIEEMLMYIQRPDVGAVGAKLYYENNTIQHAGIILGLGKDRIAGHMFDGCPRQAVGYMGRLCYAQDVSAVTGACMMVKKSLYYRLGGFAEKLAIAFNDVDLCMRIRKAGYLIVFTPYAELYHLCSKTRGAEDTVEKQKRFQEEAELFRKHWEKELKNGDPYYNPNFSLDKNDFSIK